MLRFSLFGFPVAIHWMFWVTCALIGGGLDSNTPQEFQQLLVWTAAVLISILIHELGHTFLQRKYGARSSIMLYAFGGLAIPDRNFPRNQQIAISLAGPVIQIACGIAARQLYSASHGDSLLVATFFAAFVFVSIFWGLLNLIPIYPLDGGQVLWNILGPRLEKTTFVIGIVCALGVALWMVSRGSFFATLMFGMLAFENYQRLRGQRPSGILHP